MEASTAPVPAPASQASATLRPNFTLESGCTLRDGIDMQFLLLAADCSSQQVVVDGSQVERIDTAGVQLLVAFAKGLETAGKSLQWSGTSDLLVRSCRTLGVDGLLRIPAAAASEAAQS
jgi:anti-anti-sigma regulatory factor